MHFEVPLAPKCDDQYGVLPRCCPGLGMDTLSQMCTEHYLWCTCRRSEWNKSVELRSSLSTLDLQPFVGDKPENLARGRVPSVFGSGAYLMLYGTQFVCHLYVHVFIFCGNFPCAWDCWFAYLTLRNLLLPPHCSTVALLPFCNLCALLLGPNSTFLCSCYFMPVFARKSVLDGEELARGVGYNLSVKVGRGIIPGLERAVDEVGDV